MLAWLFERKIFSPTISDPSTFFIKKTTFLLKMNFEEYYRRKIGDAKFYIHRQHKIYKFTYITFLTPEDKQIWHNFINILLCSIIIIK